MKCFSYLFYSAASNQASNKMDHMSIDLKELADSLEGEFETLSFLSEDCHIYRVPPKIWMLNETFYTSKMVFIGPLQYGKVELKPMQEHKLRYLQ